MFIQFSFGFIIQFQNHSLIFWYYFGISFSGMKKGETNRRERGQQCWLVQLQPECKCNFRNRKFRRYEWIDGSPCPLGMSPGQLYGRGWRDSGGWKFDHLWTKWSVLEVQAFPEQYTKVGCHFPYGCTSLDCLE